MERPYFTPSSFRFLRRLAQNNDRDWFSTHRDEYERHVRLPAYRFVTDCAAPLGGVSPHLSVDAGRPGSSVFRIQRDVRFGEDKTPFKTHTGVHIRHGAIAGARSPGFYLRLEPGNCFLSAGVWRPVGEAAAAIRAAIAAHPDEWSAAIGDPDLVDVWRMDGESLVRPPAGFDPDHPLIGEIRRKNFAARRRLTQRQVTAGDFLDVFVDSCRRATPLMRFVCRALGLDY
jgi:uncharacterized protein (TIGR02453 family)